jgi:hypothetical protein
MANRAQIEGIAQRIEALVRPNLSGPHIGVVFQLPGQTVEKPARLTPSVIPKTTSRR